MSQHEPPPERLQDLIDDYLGGSLDEPGLRELEALLGADAQARRYFVRYARMHTDLHLEVRARLAGQRALEHIKEVGQDKSAPSPSRPAPARSRLRLWGLLFAASLLLAAGAGWWLIQAGGKGDAGGEPVIAWLANAQDCTWADGVGPAGDMQAGKVLRIERGLAEIRFQCGARVVLQGPARLELLSGKSARLLHGRLTARVASAASGFEVLSPQGKVIDRGTEFGVAVSEKGTTDVYVFEGKVEALPAESGKAQAVSLTKNQAAQIADGKVLLKEVEPGAGAGQFVRAIVPPPVIVPRTLKLTFDRAVEGTIRDKNGLGTGLTHRLPGTGHRLAARDPNLRLDPASGLLELTTTDSDLNTQYKLFQGEYLGVRLSDLGFTGKEDFAVTVTVLDIPDLEGISQFGLYAGARSDKNIRGGLHIERKVPGQYTQFLVNNRVVGDKKKGIDTDPYRAGLIWTGTDLRLTLKRIDGKYSLTVDKLTETGSRESILTNRHPTFLDGETDLYVGLFGANTQSDVRQPLLFKDFEVTVWTVASPAPAN